MGVHATRENAGPQGQEDPWAAGESQQGVRLRQPERGSAVTPTQAGLTEGVSGVGGCPPCQPHPEEEMQMPQTNPSDGGPAGPSQPERNSKLSGSKEHTCTH